MQDGERSFLDLQKTLCNHGWNITRETLNDYLDKLVENDIIERDEFKSGLRRFSRLSKLTRIQKKIGIYTPLKSDKELRKMRNDVDKLSDETKRKLAIRLLLHISTIGVFVRQPIEDDDISNDKKHRIVLRPFKINDITDFDTSLPNEFELQLLDKAEIEKLIRYMVEEDILESRNDNDNDNDMDTSFRISQKHKLNDFLITCFNMLNLLISRVKQMIFWNNPRKMRDQLNWYRLFVSKNKFNDFCMYLDENRLSDNKKRKLEFELLYTNYIKNNKGITTKHRKIFTDLFVKWMQQFY